MSAVILSTAVAGDGAARELVWLVDLRRPDGSLVAQQFDGEGVFDDEEKAEDHAVALGRSLSLPIVDERSVEPFERSELRQDLGGAA